MTQSGDNDYRHFAFLSVADFGEAGVCGGMLLVNQIGRPIEFHCTTPVQANRTQEILYGTTLKQFLYCEQIGRTILAQPKARPDIILVSQPELLPLHAAIDQPMVLMLDQPDNSELKLVNGRQSSSLQLGNKHLTIISTDDGRIAGKALTAFHAALPIDEPFERIRQAIDEAHAAAR